MRRISLFAAIAGVSLWALACGDSPAEPDNTDPVPVPGVLTLSLTTPNADDKALLVSVTGAGTGDSLSNVVLANSSYSMYSRNENGRALKAAFFGNLANGALLQFNVPDVNRVASYNVAVVEAADGTNAVRTTFTGYVLTLSIN